jgi:acetylornithine deacetylase
LPILLSDAELLARLVGFDSTSRNSNLPIADFLCDYLDRPGVRIDRNPSADGTKTNVIAWLGPEPADQKTAREGLVLSGHMDVVPADEEGWRHDPFSLADEGDSFVGRGACDMKGFLALAANLAAAADPRTWRAPLALVFTYDEEVGTLGAKRLTETFPAAASLPRSAIIGEPTSLRVVRTHKGHTKLRVIFHGISAHSGYPHLGTNAIEPAGQAIVALAALRRQLEAEVVPYRDLFPEVPFVPLNVGTVHGGAAINVVPDRCVVELGFRPLPGVDSEELIERIADAIHSSVSGPFSPEVELISESPPLLLDEASPIHRYLCELMGQTEGASVSYATDAGWFQQLGLDCAIFGPGSIEVAHKPNEFLLKREFAAAPLALERIVRHFCLCEDREEGS